MDTPIAEQQRYRLEVLISTCALRFRGYDWAASRSSSERANELLGSMMNQFENRLTLFPTREENFATFFFIQRNFHHWGDGFFDHPNTRLAHAAVLLFLELKDLPPPRLFVSFGFNREWKKLYAQASQDDLAFVRRWLFDALAGKTAN